MRNVDGGWSLQARGADDAHLHVDADLHGSGAHLHGAGNGGHTHALVEMVILAPAKRMHNTYLQGGVIVCFYEGRHDCIAGSIH